MEAELEIVESSFHPTPGGIGAFVALVDDRRDGLTKLVIAFEEEGSVLVLGLDTLINEEDITSESHQHAGKRWEAIRERLWSEGAT